jgi:predicted DCC family thiol-disulfide oxidoreductase YuxK
MREYGLDPEEVETFVLIEDGTPFVRSEAALRIARHLRQPWRSFGVARVVPRAVRDRLYDAVARNRYRWFGRREICMVPSTAVAVRFLIE